MARASGQSGLATSHAAWFGSRAERGHAGDRDNAILAYRTALALRAGFTPAAVNLGLLLEQRGEQQMALAMLDRGIATRRWIASR